jgi:PKD repeat protein
MKLKIVILMFLMLMLPFVSFSDTVDSFGEDSTIEIKVSIIKGPPIYFNHAQHVSQFKALDGYNWTVNDQSYKFNPKKYTNRFVLNRRNEFLSRNNTDVLVIDGGILDVVRAGGTGDEGETIRGEYLNYINQGGGFIGVCGGGHFPLPLINPPDTAFELGVVNRNSFLEGMETRADGKFGIIIISEHLGVKKVGDTYKIRFRGKDNNDPAACGTAAYSDLHRGNMSDTNGIPFNLTNLDKTHPIFKDYWGDSLYVKALGGCSYIIDEEEEDNYVSSLASYPPDYGERNELTKINAWEFLPKSFNIFYDFVTISKLFINNLQGLFAIKDLPNDWQSLFEEEQEYIWIPDLVDLLSSHWLGWKKTDTIIETGNVNDDYIPKTAIIAFNYLDDPDRGRVILSGPHPFATNTWYGGEIMNHEQEKIHTRKNPGFYHWEYENGDWINPDKDKENNTFGSTERDYTNNSWYLRRQVAWASRMVPDDHLPPVYNRSQVVDINPYMQNSSEFPIYCCVDESKNIKYYGWNKFNLSLYYKWYDGIMVNPPEEWTYHDSIDSKPYKFNFNASNAEGDGVYLFCSVLNTTDRNGDYTIDEFPPGYDAKVHVNGNISAQFELESKYLYAGDSISFSSNESSTKPGTQITSYHWDFGDGNNSTDANPTHTYYDDGVYNVKLTVQNNISNSNFTIKTIRIHNNLPNIGFKPEHKVVFVNETVNFTDTSSDIDGNVTDWFWDFGDTTNSTVKNTSHSYKKSGYYVVSLEITDDDNSTARTNDGILVIDSLVNQSMSQQGNIWNNIQDAVENSITGDVIYVENGTFTKNMNNL